MYSMEGVMHLQTTGLLTSGLSRPAKTGSRDSVVLVLTWLSGYPRAVQEAHAAERAGQIPVLVKLAKQDSPDAWTWRELHLRRWPLLSVSSRFESAGWTEDELVQALKKAADLRASGWPAPSRAQPLSPTAGPMSSNTTTNDLTEDERREYLRAVNGSAMDDGVR